MKGIRFGSKENHKLLGEEMKQGSKQWKKVVAGLKSEPPHRARPLPAAHSTTLTLRQTIASPFTSFKRRSNDPNIVCLFRVPSFERRKRSAQPRSAKGCEGRLRPRAPAEESLSALSGARRRRL